MHTCSGFVLPHQLVQRKLSRARFRQQVTACWKHKLTFREWSASMRKTVCTCNKSYSCVKTHCSRSISIAEFNFQLKRISKYVANNVVGDELTPSGLSRFKIIVRIPMWEATTRHHFTDFQILFHRIVFIFGKRLILLNWLKNYNSRNSVVIVSILELYKNNCGENFLQQNSLLIIWNFNSKFCHKNPVNLLFVWIFCWIFTLFAMQ